MEEDEAIARELGNNYSASMSSPAKRTEKSLEKTPKKGVSTKSTKQSNINDWVQNSASSNKLVGSKRKTKGDTDSRPSRAKQAKVSSEVSEFNAE